MTRMGDKNDLDSSIYTHSQHSNVNQYYILEDYFLSHYVFSSRICMLCFMYFTFPFLFVNWSIIVYLNVFICSFLLPGVPTAPGNRNLRLSQAKMKTREMLILCWSPVAVSVISLPFFEFVGSPFLSRLLSRKCFPVSSTISTSPVETPLSLHGKLCTIDSNQFPLQNAGHNHPRSPKKVDRLCGSAKISQRRGSIFSVSKYIPIHISLARKFLICIVHSSWSYVYFFLQCLYTICFPADPSELNEVYRIEKDFFPQNLRKLRALCKYLRKKIE